MKLMSILSGKGFVMYNKELAHKVSVNGAIIFGQLCSSYESFGSKGMLTVRDGKEYFFLTIETLEEETALSYKQQMKAVKDLEKAGYIETRNMGVPQKRHFHITDKIVKELLSSSDKREELNIPLNPEQTCQEVTPNLDKRESLELPKGNDNTCQKVSNIKKNYKKEKLKENNKNTTSSRESIDFHLKEQFPNVPFDDVKEQLLSDNSITIETENQYKAMLTYRLKNWKPNAPKQVKPKRTELLPEWFKENADNDKPKKPEMTPEEFEAKKAKIQAILEKLRD